MKGLLEFKNLQGEIKDIDIKKRVVTGYLAAFNNVDFHNDVIERGAFKKTIYERMTDIYFLNQHNWDQPHGKFQILLEDAKGLYFESKPLVDTTYSSDLLKLYEAGIIKEHSIGYSTIVSEFNKDTNVRTLKEVKLYEGSNVTMGANPETPFTGFKCKSLKEIESEVKKITKAMRNGDFTDDTFMLLEVALKQLQKDAYELGIKSLNDIEPTKEVTLEVNEPSNIEIINEFRKSLKL